MNSKRLGFQALACHLLLALYKTSLTKNVAVPEWSAKRRGVYGEAWRKRPTESRTEEASDACQDSAPQITDY